jgi:hypothetical protein
LPTFVVDLFNIIPWYVPAVNVGVTSGAVFKLML